MAAIEVRHITKDYGAHRGVFDLSFQVGQGEVLGFLGPNGAGKTTTIRQLLGFIRPDSGKVCIYGKECFEKADEIRKNLGYLPGEIAFIDSMSGIEFIHFVAAMKGMKEFDRAKDLMKQFELNPAGKIKKMSKGMKQKIGIICAFMQDPEILILDEPTSGLDPLMQNRFVDLLLREKERGKTILMSSHIFEEVEKTCDRAVIIKEGKLVAVDSIETLCAAKQKQLEITFAEEKMAENYRKSFSKAFQVKGNPKQVTMQVGKELDEAIKKAAFYTVTDLKVQSQSLEELFLQFYGKEEEK